MNDGYIRIIHPFAIHTGDPQSPSTHIETGWLDEGDIGSILSHALRNQVTSLTETGDGSNVANPECLSLPVKIVPDTNYKDSAPALNSSSATSSTNPPDSVNQIAPQLLKLESGSPTACEKEIDVENPHPSISTYPRSAPVEVSPRTRVDVLEPESFRLIRHQLHVDESYLINSLQRTEAMETGGGKSRSVFLRTTDKRFIIKSLLTSELRVWTRNSEAFISYYKNCFQNSFPSILVPFLCVFVVHRTNASENCPFVVMCNMAVQIPGSITFDLKGMGSRRRKRTDSNDRGCSPPSNQVDYVLWDEDLREMCERRPIVLDGMSRDFLVKAVSNDTLFLASLGIVDYSMILSCKALCHDQVMDELSVGIVDYLRNFTWEKRIESAVKALNTRLSSVRDRMTWGQNSADSRRDDSPTLDLEMTPTIIKPDLYARRFRNNICSLFTSR